MTEKKNPVLTVIKVIVSVIIVFIVMVVLLFGLLTLLEYKPADKEKLELIPAATDHTKDAVTPGEDISVLTWNVGYCGLSETADFFMDGGKSVRSQNEDSVRNNLSGIENVISDIDPDVVYMQEVDRDSTRSYGIDQVGYFINNSFSDMAASYATNFRVLFIPYPIPPMGHMEAGILTLSKYAIQDSERIQLPCPFTWPSRIGNLKRCLDVSRVDVEGSDKQMVFVNLHLEAYDSGEGKIAQTKLLSEFMQQEYDKGNYVIAGGDFNQTFSSVDTSMYPQQEGLWASGLLDESAFSDNFNFVMDNSVPSCRSLDRAYDPADPNFQFYMIDGFIVSDNLEVKSIDTFVAPFKYTDHNPVKIVVSIKDEK